MIEKTDRLVNAINVFEVPEKRQGVGVFFKKGQAARRKYRILTTVDFRSRIAARRPFRRALCTGEREYDRDYFHL